MYSKVTYLFNSVILQLAKNRSLAKGEAVSTKNLLVYIELNFDSVLYIQKMSILKVLYNYIIEGFSMV